MVGLTSGVGSWEGSRRLGLPMRLRSPDERRVALDTIETVLVSLRHEDGRDYSVGQLIEALEKTQAQLLASLLDTRAPRPPRDALSLS
jgi:hypothetical protein